LAYVIYTSGSTGRPKGAMNTHRAVVNRLLWMQDEYGLTPADAVLQKTPFSFDVSVWEFFWPLLAGARLVMADPEGHRDPDYLARVINERGVTTAHFVPSMLNAFLHARGPERARTLRRVVCSGEELPYEMTERFFGQSEETGLHNLYGPTEAAVDVTYRVCRRDAPDTRVPIGRPVANTRVYVVNADGRPVAVGVQGELLIGGVQVGRGYLNRPALTAEKFVPDPFSGEAGSRLYRTGDLARWLPTGEVEYLGRMDSQVKVRGFRIELGEVEAALLRHDGVREAAVVAREDVPGEKRLVAYVVAREGSAPQAAELRGFLQKGLPDYMVPSAFVPLKALPLTSNGKLDRRALPAPDHSHDGASAAYIAPRTEAERQLAAIWQELLRVERVGVHDNFFELGGDSILSIQIVSKAHQLGLRLSPKHLFQYHTIAELAEAASGARAGADEGPVLGGSVPLTPVQRRFFEGDFAEPHHWNQSVLLETPGALDAPTLEKALEHLHLEHASLRLRFRRREGGWEQFVVAPGGPPPFEQFDLSGEPPEAQARLIEEKADELQASLNLSEGPISRAAYFKLGGEAPGRLLLIIHHLAVDAISWRILVEDLTTVYQQLAGGRDVGLPFKTASFKRWAERLDAYARTSPVREGAGYWLSEARRRARPIPLDGAGGDTVADARTLSMSLTAEETQALLREVPHALQTRIEDVLMAALGRTLSRWTGAREVLIDFEGHGREALFDDVDVSGTVGWFTSVYPVLLEMPGHDGEPLQALRGVKEQLRALPKRGIGYGLLRYAGGDSAEKLRALPRAEIVFNYLGQLDRGLPEGSFFTRAGESSGRTRSPRGRRLHLLEIIGSVAAGRLRLEWTYGEGAHRRETVERLMADFGESLRLFIEQSRSSQAGKPAPPDFPLAGLSNEQLDDILQEVSFED
jgi:non-ribosomal peptide synthase protein (TIGR01720 family)